MRIVPPRVRRDPDQLRKIHPYAWLWEPLENEATFVLRSMFGAKAAYLGGKMVLCFCAGEEPWRGVLVPTDRAHHAALRAEFPVLAPHAVLGKWLYVPESAPEFELVAATLVRLARAGDPRVGIVPPQKKRRVAPVKVRPVAARRPRKRSRR